jgi:arabinogalactan oligomer/maltooligosaccharide transport system permease protein
MKKMKDSRTSSIVLHNLLIAVLAFIWLIPIIWLLCTSFSAYSGMNTSTFFPKEWSISNYMKLFHSDSVSQFPQWFLNTFIIACFTCVISTMFVLMVAYATSVMRFKMRKPLMNMAVILNLFPGMLAMIAVYFTLKSFNLTNSYAGLIMVYSASSGLGYLIAKGFFDTVPRALCEAARIDGASKLRMFFKITLPMITSIAFFNIIMQLITALQNFTSAFVVTNGGPNKGTYVLGMKLYTDAFKYFKMGYACATSWILFIVILIMTAVLFATSKKWVYYDN